jgi:hypothetical protein
MKSWRLPSISCKPAPWVITHLHPRPHPGTQLSASSASSSTEAKQQAPVKELYTNFAFRIGKTSATSKARTALISTPHGNVQTPNFG